MILCLTADARTFAAPQLPNAGDTSGAQVVTPSRKFRGRVIDENEMPIADAKIRIFKTNDPFPGREALKKTITTDIEGDWEWDLTDLPGVVALPVIHPDYIEQEIPIPIIGLGILETRVQAAYVVCGTIVDDSGKPIENAKVLAESRGMIGDLPSYRENETVTDASGAFVFRGLQGKQVRLHAIDPNGYSAQLDGPLLGHDNPNQLKATPPSKLEFIVCDAMGAGIPGVKIKLVDWDKTKYVRWEAESDGAGKAIWANAPNGELRFTIDHEGTSTAWHIVQSPFAKTQRITLYPPHQFNIIVVDDESSKPIENVQASVIYHRIVSDFGPNESKLNKLTVSGAEGSLHITSNLDFTHYDVDFKSPGYAPKQLTIKRSDTVLPTEIRLSAIKTDEQRILSPGGTPAVGAFVVMTKRNAIVQFDENDLESEQKRKDRPNALTRIQADSLGYFKPIWASDDQAIMVHHSSGFYIGSAIDARSLSEIQLLPWVKVRFTDVPNAFLKTGSLELQFRFGTQDPSSFVMPIDVNADANEIVAERYPSGYIGTLVNSIRTGNIGRYVPIVRTRFEPSSERMAEQVISLSGNATVRGKIKIVQEFDPIPLSTVSIHSIAGTVRHLRSVDVAADGSFEFTELPPGDYVFDDQLRMKEEYFEQTSKPRSRFYLLNDISAKFTIKENESLDLGIIECERKVFDGMPEPRPFEPAFETVMDTVPSEQRVRFVVRTGRPDWQSFSTCRTERLQLLDKEANVIREFGFDATHGNIDRGLRVNDGSEFALCFNKEIVWFDPFGMQIGRAKNIPTLNLSERIGQRLLLVGPRTFNQQASDLWYLDRVARKTVSVPMVQVSIAAESPIEDAFWTYRKGAITKFDFEGNTMYSVNVDDSKLYSRQLATDAQREGCWMTFYDHESWGGADGVLMRVVDGKPIARTDLGKLMPVHMQIHQGDAYVLGVSDRDLDYSNGTYHLVRVNSLGTRTGQWQLECRDICADPEGRGIWLALSDQIVLASFEGDAMQVLETVPIAHADSLLVLPSFNPQPQAR